MYTADGMDIGTVLLLFVVVAFILAVSVKEWEKREKKKINKKENRELD